MQLPPSILSQHFSRVTAYATKRVLRTSFHGDAAKMMKRPRNRQPRSDGAQNENSNQNQHQNHRRGRGGNQYRGSTRSSPATWAQAAGAVPTIEQVVPGAGVSIVLKADQPTGDETQGVVQDVLTSGNHPRGIKVRLRDGRVGRVQRMMPEGAVAAASATAGSPAAASTRFTQRYTDVRNDEYPEEPPPRSFADFLPPDPDGNTAQSPAASANGEASVRCPICDAFEGDEAAVTYHIEQKHLGEGA